MEMVEEGKGPKDQGCQGGQRCLKVTFKYELDSKEVPSCFISFDIMNFYEKFLLTFNYHTL